MTMTIGNQVAAALRRCMAGGGELARGDQQLQALVAQLTVAGSQAPVYQRLAELLQQCVNPPEGLCAPWLLQAAALNHAIQMAQATVPTVENGQPLAHEGCRGTATLPYSRIAPVAARLEQQSPGRLQALQQAASDGVFTDIRLTVPLCNALYSSSVEVAYLAARGLRGMGQAAVPLLIQRFDAKNGRRGDRLLFKLLHALTHDDQRALTVLAQGHKALRVEAVHALAKSSEHRSAVEAALTDKQKEVRVAALKATVALGDKAALQRLQQTQPTVAERYPDELPLWEGCIKVLRLPRFARRNPFAEEEILDFE